MGTYNGFTVTEKFKDYQPYFARKNCRGYSFDSLILNLRPCYEEIPYRLISIEKQTINFNEEQHKSPVYNVISTSS